MKNDVLLLCLACYSCSAGGTTIDYSRPPEWDYPQLAVVRHYGDLFPCKNPTFLACAITDLDTSTCHIYYPESPPEWMIKHEEAHCKGYDHYGDTDLHDGWQRWKQEIWELHQ